MPKTIEQYENWAKEVAQETGFSLEGGIYRDYYSADHARGAIYEGEYKSKSAVLKLWDDPRGTDEPVALEAFHKSNESKLIVAPELYKYEILSPNRGWMIVEKLPENGSFMPVPIIDQEGKNEFAKLYLEYRKNFPTEPHRTLVLAENLSPSEFHTYRILQWFRLANDKELARELAKEAKALSPEEFVPRYQKALQVIRDEFADRKMIWCHSHFKPSEVYKVNDENKYYLIDFAHTSLKPEGYEPAFVIWGNHIVDGDWTQDYKEWRKQIEEWLNAFSSIKDELEWNDFDNLMRASLLERCLGTILADITASDRSYDEKTKRVELIYKLIDDLLEGSLL